MSGSGSDTSGFTLLEILVVLVVLGLLFVGLTQGLGVGLQSWDRQRRIQDSVSGLDATDRALRGLIEQMDPGGRMEMSDVEGTPRTLQFTTELPQAAGALSTRRAELMLLVDSRHRLLLRWASSPHFVPITPAPPVETVLLTGVDHIDLSYKSTGPAAGWQTSWSGSVPPMLVRIHIGFPPNDPRLWPDLVAAPMLQRGG